MNFIRKRADQLELEEVLDQHLKRLPCKEVVVEYLLHQRMLNRKRAKEYNNSSFLMMYPLMEKHLKETETELRTADRFGYDCDTCKDMREYLDKYTKNRD
jgi:hypothetical protein